MDEMVATEDLAVFDHPQRSRYEILIDGHLAGHAHYVREGTTVVFDHTTIEPAFEGQGLAGRLIKAALDSSRSQDLKVDPACPFVARYIERHPEYEDLVIAG